MKKIIRDGFLILIVLTIFLYGTWSFYYTTFDIKLWDESGRRLFVLFEWGIIIMSFLISGSINERK